MKKLLVLLLSILMVLSLAACAGTIEEPDSESDPTPAENPLKAIAGVWTVESINAAGNSLAQNEIERYGLDLVITLKSDGTGSIATPSNPKFTATISYTESSAKYLDTEIPFTFDGSSRISLDYTMRNMTFSINLIQIAPEDDPRAGMWTVGSVKVSGRDLSLEEITKADLYLVAVLYNDGTGVVTSPAYSGFREEITFTDDAIVYRDMQIPYTFDGSTIAFDYAVSDMTFTVTMVKN